MLTKNKATLYVLHFSQPYWNNCQHYVGYTKRPLEERLAEHRNGHGSRICKYTKGHNIDFQVVLIEKYSSPREARRRELEIKKHGGGGRFCPLCDGRKNE